MTVISFSILLLISIVSFQPVLGSDGVFARDVALQDLAVTGRGLRAAQRGEKLGRRDVKGCLRHDHQLHYLDGTYVTRT